MSIERDETIRTIRAALKTRTGRTWSVTGGRGTAWGWILITAPPARRVNWGMTDDDIATLSAAMGSGGGMVGRGGYTVPSSDAYYAQAVALASGLPATPAEPYWD